MPRAQPKKGDGQKDTTANALCYAYALADVSDNPNALSPSIGSDAILQGTPEQGIHDSVKIAFGGKDSEESLQKRKCSSCFVDLDIVKDTSLSEVENRGKSTNSEDPGEHRATQQFQAKLESPFGAGRLNVQVHTSQAAGSNLCQSCQRKASHKGADQRVLSATNSNVSLRSLSSEDAEIIATFPVVESRVELSRRKQMQAAQTETVSARNSPARGKAPTPELKVLFNNKSGRSPFLYSTMTIRMDSVILKDISQLSLSHTSISIDLPTSSTDIVKAGPSGMSRNVLLPPLKIKSETSLTSIGALPNLDTDSSKRVTPEDPKMLLRPKTPAIRNDIVDTQKVKTKSSLRRMMFDATTSNKDSPSGSSLKLLSKSSGEYTSKVIVTPQGSGVLLLPSMLPGVEKHKESMSFPVGEQPKYFKPTPPKTKRDKKTRLVKHRGRMITKGPTEPDKPRK